MILINKDTTNIVVLTLTEKVALSSPLFMLNLYNKQSKVEYNLMITDTSAYTYRYNKFSIVEMEGGNALNGQIELPKGQYIYNAYEVPTPTLVTPTTGLLEIGVCVVVGVGETEYINEDITTDKVYERQ